ncbi:cysteine-rich receptor-like protein kinase 10 [Gastrolobium bilobum]|uniref:cysteine-rich receptor-like protein kinase 10 n=1 Tax=Gastrolobium bilobum TaxID=150636 RepID=UPI002AB303C1|nr:cysteine-rich receptor-like protein kinase 10 [Gastrolobium bilobum]
MERAKLNVRSISFVFLLFLSFKPFFSKAQSPNYVGDDCHNTTQKPLSSAYQTNLDSILSWLSIDAATSKGYNHTIIGNNTLRDAVYGLYDCRGDVAGYFCQFCVSTATREVLQHCPNRVSAVIWYDFCILRYSNENFFGNVTIDPSWHAFGTKNISSLNESKKGEDFMRSLIRKATKETNQLYYMSEFNLSSTQKRYGLVQCSRDLTNEGCRQCLEAMLAQVPKCCEQKMGWQVLAASCLIKYDDYMFYLFHNQQSAVPVPNSQTAKQGVTSKSRKLIIGLSVLGSVALVCFGIYCFWCRIRVRKGNLLYEETLNTDLPTIPLITILQSTGNFSQASKLGEGGFGPVYKGVLPDGREIAVKRLSKASCQGSEEFKNEVKFIAKLQHRNLVRLLACCLDENEKLLVYEYLPNSSLNFHLFDDEKKKQLDWKLRLSIVNGIARGLLYLHEDSRLRVIHRDLKASNILLDHEMNPKISDFGLARAFERGENEANTRRVMGTYGYMAPEYAMEGLFSVKSDIFSFGVLLVEIICGKRNSGFHLSERGQSLLSYTWRKWCEGKCLELMDSVLEKSCIASEVVKCIHIGLLCVQEDAADRPTMSNVVVMLASDTMALPKPNHPAYSVGRMNSGEASTSKSSNNPSINDLTVSNILPR